MAVRYRYTARVSNLPCCIHTADMEMTRILVTGAQGLLGITLVAYLQASSHDVVRHVRKGDGDVHADLADAGQVHAMLDKIQPGVIVNLAASTNVDECERKPQNAYLSNVKIVENLTKWIHDDGDRSHLVQLSTDQVYDGVGAHKEDDVTLVNYYAFSKYAGELVAATVPSTILRTNFFGPSRCPGRVSLSDWLFESLRQQKLITVFDDVQFSPLSMATLSKMIELVIREKPVGVFNLGSHEGMSKADFAFAFAEELGCYTRTMTRSTTDKATFLKTYRPKDMRMDSSKFEKLLGVKLPLLRDELKRVAREYHDVT